MRKRNRRLARASLSSAVCFAGLVTVLVVLAGSAHGAVPVTNGIVLWLDATDPSTLFQDDAFTTLAGNGDPIGGWRDKSGNGYHAIMDDEILSPTLSNTAMNGQPAVHFDGLDGDGMYVDEGLYLERPYTAFIVNQYWGDTHGRTLQGRDANWLLGLWSGNYGAFAEGWIANRPATNDFVYVEDTTGTPDGDSTLYVNGVDITRDNTPVGVPGRLGFGSVGVYPGEVSDADVSEVVIYDRVLSQSELQQMRTFFYDKYNTTTLPGAVEQENVVKSGTIGTFTGGDPGEGLDMQGEFVYAVDVGGIGDATIGDAQFTDGSEAGMAAGESEGVTITDANEDANWFPGVNYGTSDNDTALTAIMPSIRWNVQPGVEVDLEVEAGQAYKLQLLFAEYQWDRGFDILIEDEVMVENFNIQKNQGGFNVTDVGVVYTKELVAPDGELNILLGGPDPVAPDNNPLLQALTLEIGSSVGVLQPGDADMDYDFDQLDLVKVQIGGKYLTAQAATWGDGDWEGGPGGSPGNPPPGNGRFDQIDIIAALNAGKYLTGKYAALAGPGQAGDGQTSVGYNEQTGEVWVDAPAGKDLTSINIESAAGIFTGSPAQNLGGSFDNDTDNNIFKATFGSSFGSLSFGNVAQAGLSKEVVLGDLTIVGSLAGGGDLGQVDLIYVPIPEPATLALGMFGLALLGGLVCRRVHA